ncbi:MAG: tetratricopeptide repeat protein [Balneolaceae bacterium]
MKSYSQLLSFFFAVVLAFGITQLSHAQDDTRTQAITKYNEAQELASARQFTDAIEIYREALELAKEIEDEEIIQNIEERIPRAYSSRASSSYSAFQSERNLANANQAIEDFEASLEAGEEFGNDQVVEQATRAIPQLYYIRSVVEYRQDDFEGAMVSLDAALELNPNYPTAHYQKGVVYKKQNPEDIDGALEFFDTAIELAEQAGDNRTLNNAREGAAEELIYRANTLKENDDYSRAIELLERVEQYDPQSADAYYRLAEVNNLQGNWAQAIEHANQALEFESGGVVEQAKIYFELGMAHKGEGDTTNACSAFENADYGDFSDPASHELEFELECEGYTANGRR